MQFLMRLDRRLMIIIGMLLLVAVLLFVPTLLAPPEEPFDPVVSTTDPINGAVSVSEQVNIEIVFDGEVPVEERENFSVSASPSVEFNKAWPKNNRLLLIPETLLQTNGRYTVRVMYKQEQVYSMSFTVTAFTEAELEQQAVEQTEHDIAFNEELFDFYKEYPWYVELPVIKDNYKILYDFNRAEFRIALLVDPATPEEQLNVIRNMALDDIRSELGANPDELGYYFEFLEEEPAE